MDNYCNIAGVIQTQKKSRVMSHGEHMGRITLFRKTHKDFFIMAYLGFLIFGLILSDGYAATPPMLPNRGIECANLHYAAIIGDVARVEQFIREGADVNERDWRGVTPLHAAAEFGNLDVVNSLIQSGSDVEALAPGGRSALFAAIAKGHLDVADALIRAGANVGAHDANGQTLMHCAMEWLRPRQEAIRIVDWLIQNNAPVDREDAEGRTPLLLALETQFDPYPVLETLLARGARPNVQASDGNTPLLIALAHGDNRSARILLAHNADPNIAGERGILPLHLSAFSDEISTETFRLILERTANRNRTTDLGGMTPLHFAVKGMNIPKIKLLLACGVDVEIKDGDGKTALDYTLEPEVEEVSDRQIIPFSDKFEYAENKEKLLEIQALLKAGVARNSSYEKSHMK